MDDVEKNKNLIGDYINVLLTKGAYRGSYSGSVTSLLAHLLKKRKIDGVFTTMDDDNLLHSKAVYAKNTNDLKKTAGMRHSVSSFLSNINTIPTNDNIALVGLPCHIDSINKARKNGIIKNNIKILIGIACGTNYDYSMFAELLYNHNIDISKIEQYTLRDTEKLKPYFSFTIEGEEKKLPVSETIKCIPTGCIHCNDYLGLGSDISFSVLGAPRGWSLVFVRTERGNEYLDSASKNGFIETRKARKSIIRKFYHALPKKLYMSIAFRTSDSIAAQLMADFKVNYLNKRLLSKTHV